MKIKITVGGNDRTAIILPIENAGLAAELLARATIWERDGYYSNSGWKRTEEGVRIEYTDGAELEPTHPKVEAAEKETAKQRSEWHDEYRKCQALEKKLADVTARLEAIQSVTVCTQEGQPTQAPAEPAEEAVDRDPDLPF